MPQAHRRDDHHPGGQRRAIGRLDIFDLSRRVTRSLGGQQSAESLDFSWLACAMDATSEGAWHTEFLPTPRALRRNASSLATAWPA